MKKLLVITVAIIMVFAFTANISAEAAFFAGSSGSGITTGVVNGKPFYTSFGAEAMYTSTDGEGFLKRYIDSSTPIAGIDSLVYGNNIGIGIDVGEITAKLFDSDMNFDKNVYSFVEGTNGEDGYFIHLIPEIYYDSYSSLFFCHGFNDETKDLDVYYTNGTMVNTTYGTGSVDALVWNKVTGDLLDLHPWDYNGPADDQDFTLGWLSSRPFFITGNSSGYLFISYGSNLNQRCAPVADGCSCGIWDARRGCSVIKASEYGDVIGGHGTSGQVMMPRGGGITENGVIVHQAANANTTRLYVSSLNGVEFETGTIFSFANNANALPGYAASEVTATTVVSGNDVYFTKAATNQLYRVSVSVGDSGATLGSAENILQNSSFGNSASSGWVVKDLKTIGTDSAIMLLNGSSEAYLYAVDLKTGALKALSADDTYVNIDVGSTSLTIAPNTYAPHGLTLQIGSAIPTTDKMIYEYSDTEGAKYKLDLDGIDVNGVFAWDDAVSGECRFTLTARSADYPSVMKTAQITATVGE